MDDVMKSLRMVDWGVKKRRGWMQVVVASERQVPGKTTDVDWGHG
jgi:hypothetical protein